jgi:hypothetical protein
MAPISRNLESGGIYINRWMTGVYTQRSPLFTPMSAMGLQMISRQDSLIDGLNMEISPVMTPVQRPGYPRYCTAAFGINDYPLAFYSFKNLSGTIKTLADTPTKLVSFTTSAQTTVFAKSGTAQGSAQVVGDMLYYCDGTDADAKKWNGTTASKWGIVAPVVAPTLGFTSGPLTVQSGYKYVFVYKNSSTGHVSTASPASANTGALTAQSIQVGYTASADPQVDKIDIYRTEDGGSLYYFLAEVVNGTSTYTDSTADSGLNNDLVAPLTGNDPPPSGISLVVFHVGRMWVVVGNKLYFGSGPDVTNGVGEESFYLPNVFTFPGAINAIASTSVGLVVFTSSDAYIVQGNSLATFQHGLWQKNFGVASQNCIAQDGDVLFVFTSRGQLFELSDSLEEIGLPIRNQLKAFTPGNVYIALHRSGDDEGLFVSDGASNIWRYSIAMQSWSPVAQPVGGVRAISSIETSTSVWTLLAGRTSGSGYILGRSLAAFNDDGVTYSGFITVGSLILAPPGKTARADAVLAEVMPVGTYPTISVLLNEVSGAFVALPNPVADPPKLANSTTVRMKRHYLKSAASPLAQGEIRHLQIKVNFVAEDAKHELLGLGIQ